MRAKGHFWLATRPDWVGELSIAGAVCKVSAMGFWWSAIPKSRWPDHEEWRKLMNRHWSPVWGDRRQELVFIGIGMDEAAIRAELDACLVGSTTAAKIRGRDLEQPSRPLPGLAQRKGGVRGLRT